MDNGEHSGFDDGNNPELGDDSNTSSEQAASASLGGIFGDFAVSDDVPDLINLDDVRPGSQRPRRRPTRPNSNAPVNGNQLLSNFLLNPGDAAPGGRAGANRQTKPEESTRIVMGSPTPPPRRPAGQASSGVPARPPRTSPADESTHIVMSAGLPPRRPEGERGGFKSGVRSTPTSLPAPSSARSTQDESTHVVMGLNLPPRRPEGERGTFKPRSSARSEGQSGSSGSSGLGSAPGSSGSEAQEGKARASLSLGGSSSVPREGGMATPLASSPVIDPLSASSANSGLSSAPNVGGPLSTPSQVLAQQATQSQVPAQQATESQVLAQQATRPQTAAQQATPTAPGAATLAELSSIAAAAVAAGPPPTNEAEFEEIKSVTIVRPRDPGTTSPSRSRLGGTVLKANPTSPAISPVRLRENSGFGSTSGNDLRGAGAPVSGTEAGRAVRLRENSGFGSTSGNDLRGTGAPVSGTEAGRAVRLRENSGFGSTSGNDLRGTGAPASGAEVGRAVRLRENSGFGSTSGNDLRGAGAPVSGTESGRAARAWDSLRHEASAPQPPTPPSAEDLAARAWERSVETAERSQSGDDPARKSIRRSVASSIYAKASAARGTDAEGERMPSSSASATPDYAGVASGIAGRASMAASGPSSPGVTPAGVSPVGVAPLGDTGGRWKGRKGARPARSRSTISKSTATMGGTVGSDANGVSSFGGTQRSATPAISASRSGVGTRGVGASQPPGNTRAVPSRIGALPDESDLDLTPHVPAGRPVVGAALSSIAGAAASASSRWGRSVRDAQAAEQEALRNSAASPGTESSEAGGASLPEDTAARAGAGGSIGGAGLPAGSVGVLLPRQPVDEQALSRDAHAAEYRRLQGMAAQERAAAAGDEFVPSSAMAAAGGSEGIIMALRREGASEEDLQLADLLEARLAQLAEQEAPFSEGEGEGGPFPGPFGEAGYAPGEQEVEELPEAPGFAGWMWRSGIYVLVGVTAVVVAVALGYVFLQMRAGQPGQPATPSETPAPIVTPAKKSLHVYRTGRDSESSFFVGDGDSSLQDTDESVNSDGYSDSEMGVLEGTEPPEELPKDERAQQALKEEIETSQPDTPRVSEPSASARATVAPSKQARKASAAPQRQEAMQSVPSSAAPHRSHTPAAAREMPSGAANLDLDSSSRRPARATVPARTVAPVPAAPAPADISLPEGIDSSSSRRSKPRQTAPEASQSDSSSAGSERWDSVEAAP